MKKARNIFLFTLALTFSLLGISQPCQFIDITTTPLLVLPDCNDSAGTAIFTNTQGGSSPYKYTFNDETNQVGSFNELKTGVYQLIITDLSGCKDTFPIDLTYRKIEDIIRPNNAFTPNGDGFNDTWFIPAIESFNGSEVRVFNRWGQRVHQNSEYSNENGWDGTQGGSKLPEATYYYVISIVNNCVEEHINGTVTIIR